MNILQSIRSHSDLQSLDGRQRAELCDEIRSFLIENVSATGGHLASNLGVVELSVALETVFDTEKDRLVFDVGHQCYVHKILTGRISQFHTLRKHKGISGFPKPSESISDAFTAGHASTAVSVALGMARARTLLKEDYHVVALLGDGAATGGPAYEGLSNAAVSKEPLIVILNDNAMSIDKNVGGVARHLAKMRSRAKYLGLKEHYKSVLSRLPGGKRVSRVIHKAKRAVRRMLISPSIFENMGFTYIGPMDGHDCENLISVLQIAKDMKRPVLIHVVTHKGSGYAPAEMHPDVFHGIGKFDAQSGAQREQGNGATFSSVFGETLCVLAEQNDRICAITAAMPQGTGLCTFRNKFPKRYFDVGIAESHAVSMAAGMAKNGLVPVFAVYSTFLQRCYDAIEQDVCLQNLHVVFGIDRAGLVGADGETHQGTFDVGMLLQMPGMTLLAPCNCRELPEVLRHAVSDCSGPVAVRYSKGTGADVDASEGDVVCHRKGADGTVIVYGELVGEVLKAADVLQSMGISMQVLRLKKVFPIDFACLAVVQNKPVFIAEEAQAHCGIGEFIAANIQNKCYLCNLGDKPLGQGSVSQQRRDAGLDCEGIVKRISEEFQIEE